MSTPETIFLNARELRDPAERDAYLTASCAGNPDLRDSVMALLAAADHADAYFGQADGILPPPHRARPDPETPGAVIGRYEIESRLGEGGMGIVYRARQTSPIVRPVALKVIKLGMDTRRVVARFEAERQALAMMDHPNIARVLDAGSTEAGRPYFVMELVDGPRLTDHCDQHRLPVLDRLRLFIQVCHAVQHAHQKGIIHRDLKPSNVLVAPSPDPSAPGSGSPRIIDFGIAKAVQTERSGADSVTTHIGLLGTPTYMSPEQALSGGTDVDTRTDIYSLGVLLHELLTGRTPFAGDRLAPPSLPEMVQRLTSVEPLRPSAQLAALSADELRRISDSRSTSAVRLIHQLRGDLESIIGKCLEKDRSRRYASAWGLASDLQRYLAHEPVTARPPSSRDRLTKAFRRHRATFIASGFFALLLLAASLISTWLALRASKAERQQTLLRSLAEQAAQESDRRLYFSQMTQAQHFWDVNKFGSLRELLHETASSPHRGFEWAYWRRMAHLDALTYSGQPGSISALAISPDSSRIVTGDGHPSLQVWDARSGQLVRRWDHLREPVKSAAFSGDGGSVYCAGKDGLIRAFDLATGSETNRTLAHPDGVTVMVSASSGRRLYTGGLDHLVKAWTTSPLALDRVLADVQFAVVALALAPDDSQLAVGTVNKEILRFHLPDGQPLGRIAPSAGDAEIHHSLAYSPDGSMLASGDFNGRVSLWSVADGQRRWRISGHSDAVSAITFSRDNRFLFTGSADHRIAMRSVEDGRELAALRGHSSVVNALATSPDGRFLASGESDATAKIWDLARARANDSAPYHQFTGHSDWLQGVEFFPDSKRLLTYVNGAWIWDAETGQELGSFTGHAHMVFAAAIAPDGERVATAGDDLTLRLWSASSGSELARLTLPSGILRAIRYFPDGRRFATVGDDGTPRIHDAESGAVVREASRFLQPLTSLAISPDGRWLAAGDRSGTVRIWDAHTGAIDHEIPASGGPAVALAFAPQASRLLVGTSTPVNRLTLLEYPGGRILFEKKVGTSGLHMVRYSPDGRRLLVVNESPVGLLIDAETGNEVMSLRGERDFNRAGAFSPDGHLIALGTLGVERDHAVRIWRAAPASR
ncbi:MAG: protein kinase [Verrucomicrobiales bacterium]|nr:protein kinase [Verrucomicrobiales bacterium]